MNTTSIFEIKPQFEGSSVYFSKFHHTSFSKKTTTSGVAIKYVISGVENYCHDTNHVQVKAGHYLLLNKERNYEVFIEYAIQPVVGLCINLSEATISDVLYNFQHEDGYLLENPFFKPGDSFDFFESVFQHDNLLSRHLQSLVPYLNGDTGSLDIDDSELYYGIANNLLASQTIISRQISGISIQRPGVKKELYKRLMMAKTIMDDSSEYHKISDIATMATLSEFHFFRTFKQAFGITPHQYQIKSKLEKAVCLLTAGRSSIESVAYDCGFADVFTFSKTFKKYFKVPPSVYKNNCKTKTDLFIQ